MFTTNNPRVRSLPAHLFQYVVEQNYEDYTAVDQAVWRYIMRKSSSYLPQVAHPKYLEGLRETGIGIEEIPNIETMNKIMEEIGWGAVTVDGFIPPAAFMEFQKHQVLPIAA